MGLASEIQKTAVDRFSSLRHFRLPFAGSPSPVADILLLSRDLDSPRVTLEPMFRRYTSYWVDGPTLDGTYFALDCLQYVHDEPRLPSQLHDRILERADAHRKRDGGYWVQVESGNSSLYATYSYIGILKNLSSIPCGMPLDHETVEKAFPGDRVQLLMDFVRTRFVPEHGGFFDGPHWPVPCVMATSLAAGILWNLGRSDEFTAITGADSVCAFLEQCMRRGRVGRTEWLGFAATPSIQSPGISVTCHALRLIRNQNLPLPVEDEEVRAFLDTLYAGGGWAGVPGESASTLATSYALRILKSLSDGDLVEEEEALSALKDFLSSCRSAGLYALAPGFSPSAIGTRCALQAADLVRSEINCIDHDQQMSTRAAIFNELLWEESAGFSIYPKSMIRDTMPPGFGDLLSDAFTYYLAPLRALGRAMKSTPRRGRDN